MRRLTFLLLGTALVFLLLTGFKPDEDQTIIIELDENPAEFVKQAKLRLPRLEIVAEYDTIFNGVAVKGTARELEKIARLDTVVNQYPVHTYKALFEKSDPQTTEKIRKTANLPFTGKGVKVGVIDTGIDYHHPDLQANYKGGFDLVDFDDDPMETEGEGATDHGTHVAGIIAADGKMKGIAPDADIYAYRALGPGGAGSSVQVIAAIEEAVKDGMDVINLSLGNDVNGPDWPTSKAVNKAIELGVVVVVAAGNSGPDTWTVGSPATSPDAITVGASARPSEASVLTVPGEDRQISLLPLQNSAAWNLGKKFPLMDGGNGEAPLSMATGKIVLMERGVVPFSKKALKAYRRGAKALIIYNNEKGAFQGSLEGLKLPIPVVSITKEEGEWLKRKAIEENQWVETRQEKVDQSLAPFSSRGPVTTSWAIKPDILAPGVDIFSTVPGGYKALSGTSMASPHVAGVAALIKEAHPDWTPAEIKTSLMSTADLIKNKQDEPYVPTEQGAGYIDPEEAIHPKLWISPGSLRLGKLEEKKFLHANSVITLTNTDHQTKTFHFLVPDEDRGVSWSMPSSVTLAPNQSEKVKVEASLSKAFLSEGIHQGYVKIEGPDETYSLPYLFMNEGDDYAKISGFELFQDWETSKDLSYRFYLTEDAEEVTVDLYRAGTMLSIGRLFSISKPSAGTVEGEADVRLPDLAGPYVAVVTVERNDQTNSYPFPVMFQSPK